MEEILNNLNKEQIISYSRILNNLSPTEFISLGYIISLLLCECLSPDEQNTLGNFLEMIGQILVTSYAQASATIPQYMQASIPDLQNLKKDIYVLLKNYIKK